MKNLLKRLFVEEDGYGTVEMILLIAGIGLLSTGVFSVLQDSIAGEDNSAVSQVGTNINSLLEDWKLDETIVP